MESFQEAILIFHNKKGQFEFKDYIITFIVSALFIISLYSFMTSIGDKNDKDFTIDNNKIDFIGLKKNLSNINDESETWQQAVTDDTVDKSLAIVVLVSIAGVAKLMWQSIIFIAKIYAQVSYNILHIDPIVSGSILTILIILIIFAFWRVIKNG